MFCPSCRDEFRAGFTHCAGCDVDLVESLDEAPAPAVAERRPPGPVRMADYCGFFDLGDARGARDKLRALDVAADILIRETPDSDAHGSLREEYWLRVDASEFATANQILEHAEQAADSPEADTVQCPSCDARVASAESFCPRCGARFVGA